MLCARSIKPLDADFQLMRSIIPMVFLFRRVHIERQPVRLAAKPLGDGRGGDRRQST